MAYIIYWAFWAVWLVIALFYMITKRFRMVEFVTFLSFLGLAEIVGNILAHQMHLYYYLDQENNIVYSMLYYIIVYPASGIVYSRLFPKNETVWNLGMYSLAWIVIYIILEIFVIKRYNVIVYTGWKVIPYSLLLYVIAFPLYYKTIRKKLVKLV